MKKMIYAFKMPPNIGSNQSKKIASDNGLKFFEENDKTYIGIEIMDDEGGFISFDNLRITFRKVKTETDWNTPFIAHIEGSVARAINAKYTAKPDFVILEDD